MYDFGFTAEYIEVLGLIKSDNIKSITEFDYPEKLTKDVKVINYAASLGKFEIVKYLHSKGAVLDHIGFMAACLHGDSCVIKYYTQNMPEYRYSMPHILGINHRDQNEYFRYFGYDKIKVLICKEFMEYFEKNYTINDSDSNNIHNFVSSVMFHYNKQILHSICSLRDAKIEECNQHKISELLDTESLIGDEVSDLKCKNDTLSEQVEKLTLDYTVRDLECKKREQQLLEEISGQDNIIKELSDKIVHLKKELNKKMQIIQKYHSRSAHQ